jgi:hypothetical protein
MKIYDAFRIFILVDMDSNNIPVTCCIQCVIFTMEIVGTIFPKERGMNDHDKRRNVALKTTRCFQDSHLGFLSNYVGDGLVLFF